MRTNAAAVVLVALNLSQPVFATWPNEDAASWPAPVELSLDEAIRYALDNPAGRF